MGSLASGPAVVALVVLLGTPAFAVESAEPVELAAEPAPPSGLQDDPFPMPDSLREHVAFWRNAFSLWRTDQVVVHDMDHPELVYEVVALPGEPGDTYTPEQQDWVTDLREVWEGRLKGLEEKIEARQSLLEEEKALALRMATTAGTDAVRGASGRVRTQRGLRERFQEGVEVSTRYLDLFRRVFRDAGLPEDLAYLPHVESSFQLAARSKAGAVGMWQFTRTTGRKYLTINAAVDERLDPLASALGAAQYFRKAYELLGDWPLAVTSYNYGVEGTLRARETLGANFERIVSEHDGRGFGFASRNFYAEFLAAREIAREPERFFPDGLDPEPPLALDRIVLERAATPPQISRLYGVSLKDLAGLNPAWRPRAVRGELPLPVGSFVWLPEGTLARVAPAREGDAGAPNYHVVRRGETLASIARAHGITVAELRRLNGIPSRSNLIRAGERLRVGEEGLAAAQEEPGHFVHVVRRGETLLRIAGSYGVKLADILLVNRLTETSVIRPGQRLQIPSKP